MDIYPQADRMIFWIKQESGKVVRLEDEWSHSIYVAADNKLDLLNILRPFRQEQQQLQQHIASLVKSSRSVFRYEKITDREKSEVLKITLANSAAASKLAGKIELLGHFSKFRLYNVDVSPAQSYFYEHELFPLAYCTATTTANANGSSSRIKWDVQDHVWSTDYSLPNFTSIELSVQSKKQPQQQARLASFDDAIASITLVKKNNDNNTNDRVGGESSDKDGSKIVIEGQSEAQILCELESEVAKADPDFIFVQDGDSFVFPYLIHRAFENGISLSLSREKNVRLNKPAKEGTSYFSYGKIHFKPTSTRLYGRVHLDANNSFTLDESGPQGLYEIARICRMPLHTASRASIGKCLSSLQFYHATCSNILVPWKPTLGESFKSFTELLIADRGGLVFEPEMGVHEEVAELDFVSLYPSIMCQKNVSAETVRCECCSSSKERVPELDYNICEKKSGIVSQALEIVIKKRARYKELKRKATEPCMKARYDSRQDVLKWINVTSFGYLGFNNAKFGRIDAHIAVCAFDRKILLQAAKIVEEHGFEVIHGIVDSLWIQKSAASPEDYMCVKEAIEKETGFALLFEGVYKWIVFSRSKMSDELPVANRYFGVFGGDGGIKIRGIEARRHDTPPLFVRFQKEVIKIMARGNSVAEVKNLMPEVWNIFCKYRQQLREKRVRLSDLVFTKSLSKDSSAYTANTVETSAVRQLEEKGKRLRAGEVVQYVITSYRAKDPKRRTIPVELVDLNNYKDDRTGCYDAEKYIELLAYVCNSITEPFGFPVTATMETHADLHSPTV